MLPETEVLLKIPTDRISFNPSTLIIDPLRSAAGQTAFVFRCDATILSKNRPSAFPQKRPSCRPVPLFAPATLFSNKNPFKAILDAAFFSSNSQKLPCPSFECSTWNNSREFLAPFFKLQMGPKKFRQLFNSGGFYLFGEWVVCRFGANGVQMIMLQVIQSGDLRRLGTRGVRGFRHGVLADLLPASNLPLCLVEGDADRCCQIQAAGLGLHGHL